MFKTAFVTGADRGVGLALVSKLLKCGYRVFAGQYAEEGLPLLELKRRYADRLHVLRLDISSGESVAEALRQTSEQTGHLDLLINNAAILGDIQATIQLD